MIFVLVKESKSIFFCFVVNYMYAIRWKYCYLINSTSSYNEK